MKAFLLAAGHGTRLRPLTDTVPKCLVPIRGTPMLQIWLELCGLHGITSVIVNIHSHARQVREFLSGIDVGVNVSVFEEHTLLGSAGTLLANRSWIQNEENFWVFYADVLTTTDLTAMKAFHARSGSLATIGVYAVQDPSRCGVVTADDRGIVRGFIEKPAVPGGNTVFSGILIGSPAILDAIAPKREADIARDLLPKLIGQMHAYPITEFLVDVGTLSNYNFAQESWPGLSIVRRAKMPT